MITRRLRIGGTGACWKRGSWAKTYRVRLLCRLRAVWSFFLGFPLTSLGFHCGLSKARLRIALGPLGYNEATADSVMGLEDSDKVQPWKSYPPPPEKQNSGHVYPQASKGQILVLSTRGSSLCRPLDGSMPGEEQC